QPGQLLTGRKSISSELKISESKVTRILKSLEIEQQIEQQTSNKNRLISIVSWTKYQNDEQQNEQQLNNKRTTTEQQVNTNKNVKNIKNERMKEDIVSNDTSKRFIPPTLEEVKAYCIERNNKIDAQQFIDFYTAKGWMV